MVVSESMDRVCRERPAEENLRRSIASTNLATLRNDGAINFFLTNQERLFDSEKYIEREIINMKLLITKLHILNARLTFGAFLFPCLVFVMFYYHL